MWAHHLASKYPDKNERSLNLISLIFNYLTTMVFSGSSSYIMFYVKSLAGSLEKILSKIRNKNLVKYLVKSLI